METKMEIKLTKPQSLGNDFKINYYIHHFRLLQNELIYHSKCSQLKALRLVRTLELQKNN